MLFALQPQSVAAIVGALLIVMLLDLLTMLFANTVLHALGAFLAVLGGVLGILQVALSVQLLLAGLRMLLGTTSA